MKKDFSKFGVSPQNPLYLLELDERELDLLRMSVRGLYSHFYVRKDFHEFSQLESYNEHILSELNELYWKIFNLY